MKNTIKWLGIIAVLFLFYTCVDSNDNNSNDVNDNPNPTQETTVVFDNSKGICDVVVYSSHLRSEGDIIDEIPKGKISKNEIKWYPGPSVPFFISYKFNLVGTDDFDFTMMYTAIETSKDQIYPNINANEKNNIKIPTLSEVVFPDKLMSNNSYILIKNESGIPIDLLRGGGNALTVNAGDQGNYTIKSTDIKTVSSYQLRENIDYSSFPSLDSDSFEPGKVYLFTYKGSHAQEAFVLDNIIDIKIENVDTSVTVSFNSRGGSDVSSKKVVRDNTLEKPLEPTRSGEYHFYGWYKEDTFVNLWNFDTDIVTGFITLYARWSRTETRTFSNPSVTESFNIGTVVRSYPATIEVYALGAGGGGQGGHRFEKWWVGDTNFTGTGAQGGGGAAAYIKFTRDKSAEFEIIIGRRGDGGSGQYRKATITNNSWLSGIHGGNGGPTSVNIVGVTTITAGGGHGGSGGGGDSTATGGAISAGSAGNGGNGGSVTRPANIPEQESEICNGGNGSNGIISGEKTSIDNAASISRGSFSPFGGSGSSYGKGGKGGYGDTGAGSPGGDGLVVIVVTWFE